MASRQSNTGCFIVDAARDVETNKIEEKLRELVEACNAKGLRFLGIYRVNRLRPTPSNIYRLECLLKIEEHSELGLMGAPVKLAPPSDIDAMDINEVKRQLRDMNESTAGREPLLRRRLNTARLEAELEARAS